MLIELPFNETQLLGLFSFGLATFAALSTSGSLRAQSRQRSLHWRWIGIFQLAYLFEIYFGARHLAHDFINTTLRSVGLYQDRASIQGLLLIGVAAGSLAIATMLRRRIAFEPAQSSAEKIALLCTAIALLLFLIETISLHAIDRVLYWPMGSILLIGYLWLATSIGVVFAARRALNTGESYRTTR